MLAIVRGIAFLFEDEPCAAFACGEVEPHDGIFAFGPWRDTPGLDKPLAGDVFDNAPGDLVAEA